MDNRSQATQHDTHAVEPTDKRTEEFDQEVEETATDGHDHDMDHSDMDHSADDAHVTADDHTGHEAHENHDDGHSDEHGDEHGGHGAPRRSQRPRRDVPAQVLGVAAALHPRAALQPDPAGVAGLHACPPSPAASGSPRSLPMIVFVYGGLPFLQMAVPEVRKREPGMMTLISLAITVAFVYSMVALFLPGSATFFWELVTLIDIMLLGHWIEMRSVRQASGALDELAKLMPDTAERVDEDGNVEEVPSSQLRDGDVVLVRPGASIPADGEVVSGDSDVNEAMITGESKPVLQRRGRQGDRRVHQRRRQPARARHRHRRTDGAGRHHAPGRGRAAEQVATPRFWPTAPRAGSFT